MDAVAFLDCAVNIAAIGEMVDDPIEVSYENPDEPVLILTHGGVESIVPVGSWIVRTDDGGVLVLDEDSVRQAVLLYMAAHDNQQ